MYSIIIEGSNFDNYFPNILVGLHVLMSHFNIFHVEHAVNHRPQGRICRLEVWQNLLGETPDKLCFILEIKTHSFIQGISQIENYTSLKELKQAKMNSIIGWSDMR